jgi:hypothetical protein
MGQPVKVSKELLLDARLAGGILRRSIAGQIEFWARLGRAIEPLLDGAHALALQQAGRARPLSELLDSVEKPEGRRRLAAVLKARPFPHFAPAPGRPGFLVRTEADGSRSVGRFVGRQFKTVR